MSMSVPVGLDTQHRAASSPAVARDGQPGVEALDEPVRRYLEHAVGDGHRGSSTVRLEMTGHIKLGVWLPWTANEACDGRSFEWRARVFGGVLQVRDRFADGAGSTEGRLFGRRRLFRQAGPDTARSGAGRAALEAIWAPASLLPDRGVTWRAESEDHIVASFDVAPERAALHLRIDAHGAVRSASALRWGNAGQDTFEYIPCGSEVHAERRFGDLTVPSSVSVGWWFGTPRYTPFFRAEIRSLAAASLPA